MPNNTLEITALLGIPLIEAGDKLDKIIDQALSTNDIELQTGDVLVIAQKIISKAEGRLRLLSDIKPTKDAEVLAAKVDKDPRLVTLILNQSNHVIRAVPGVLIVENKLGMVHANAGIDQSNIEQSEHQQTALLLPENPDSSADALRQKMNQTHGVKIAVIINDSTGRAWRNGTCGIAIGSAGLDPLCDQIGEADLFDNELQSTVVAVADELAAAASLLMGQAAESRPVVLIRGAQFTPSNSKTSSELLRPTELDLFR